MKCYSVVYRFKGESVCKEKFFNTAREAWDFYDYVSDLDDCVFAIKPEMTDTTDY